MAATVYATVADLEAFWKPLDSTEEARATTLLGYASSRLRLEAAKADIDLDQAVQEDGDYALQVKLTVMEAVKRAMSTPIDIPPVDSFAQSAGPYSENYKFTNPSGDLWFKKAELKALGFAGVQKLGSITPNTRKEIYGE